MINPNKLGRSPFPASASQWMLVGLRGGVTPPANVHLLNALNSYWKLDEASGTRSDSQGTNHLTANGAPVGVAGKISNGCKFISANSQSLTVANNSSLQVTSDFTFSAWVNMTSVATDEYIFTKTQPGVNSDYKLFFSASGVFVAGVGTAALGSDLVIGTTTVSAGVWMHIAFWFDHLTGQTYLRVNDAVTNQSTTSPALVQTTGALAFGIAGIGGANYLDAIIDEVGFWKRVLTAQEITALYNGGAGLPYSSFTA